MFAAYSGGAGDSNEPPDNPRDKNAYVSYPIKRNYEEEIRIMENRKKKEAREKIQAKLERMKETLVYQGIQRYDSSEEDDDDYPCIRTGETAVTIAVSNTTPITQKTKKFVQSKRKKSSSPSSSSSESSSDSEARSRKHKKHKKKKHKKEKKRRRHSSSPEPGSSNLFSSETILYEASEAASKARFKKWTTNMKNYSKQRDMGNVPISRSDAVSLPVHHLMVFDYHPMHDNFNYDRGHKAQVISNFLTDIALSSKGNDMKEIHANKVFNTCSKKPEQKQKTLRYFECRFNKDDYESTFRTIYPHEENGITKVSQHPDILKPLWMIQEEQLAEKNKEKELTKIKKDDGRRLLDEEILECKLKIKNEPKVPQHYIDFINKEDELFERRRLEGQQSGDKSGLNERKIAILDQGVKTMPKEISLHLERLKILKDCNKNFEDTIREWETLYNRFPNDPNIIGSYLDFLQYDNVNYNPRMLRAFFQKSRTNLQHMIRGIYTAHKPSPESPDILFKLWIRELNWLAEQGRYAEMIASIQASIEYSFFQPSIPPGYDINSWFNLFWDSAQPRIGDIGYNGGFVFFNPEMPADHILQMEFQEVEYELQKYKAIYKEVTNDIGDTEAMYKIEMMADNIFYRPLRNPIKSWTHFKEEIQDHIENYKYVGFKELALITLRDQDVAALLCANGLKVQEGEYFDWYRLSRQIGAPLGTPAIPASAYEMLCRIQWHMVAYTRLSVSIPYLVESHTECALRKHHTIGKNMFEYLDSFHKQLQFEQEARKNGNISLETLLKQDIEATFVTDFVLFEQISNEKMVKNLKLRFGKILDIMCSRIGKERTHLNQRAALAYLLRFAEHFNDDLVTFENGKLFKWLELISGQQIPDNSKPHVVNVLEHMIINTPVLNSTHERFMPGIQASATALLIHINSTGDSRKNLKLRDYVYGIYDVYKHTYGENVLGLQEVHYALILSLQKEWNVNRRYREYLVKEIRHHMNSYPYDYRVIKIGLQFLKKRVSTIFVNLPQRYGGENPLIGSLDKNMQRDAIETLIKIAIADKEQLVEEEKKCHSIRCATIVKEAKKLKDPYLWRLAASIPSMDSDKIYTDAFNYCRFSKYLHMNRFRLEGTHRALQESCQLMKECKINVHFTPEHIAILREKYIQEMGRQ